MLEILVGAALAAAQVAPMPKTTPPPPASQDFGYLTGGALYQRCTEENSVSVSYCFAYLAAVHDSVRAYEVWLKVREFCPTSRLTQSDLRDAYLSYAKQRPADLSGQAATIALAALKLRYPCAVQLPDEPPPAALNLPSTRD